jgi:hypothetical protein
MCTFQGVIDSYCIGDSMANDRRLQVADDRLPLNLQYNLRCQPIQRQLMSIIEYNIVINRIAIRSPIQSRTSEVSLPHFVVTVFSL